MLYTIPINKSEGYSMEKIIGVSRVVAEDFLWEVIDENPKFNAFIGQCITHFVHD